MKVVYASADEALEAVKVFQQLLGLTHWEIKIDIVDKLDERWGEIHSNVNKRQALIRLLSSEAAENEDEDGTVVYFKEFDHERTLIHELLHLHLAPLDPLIETNPLSEQIIETAVHSLSVTIKGLLEVARRSSKETSPLSGNESESDLS